MPQYNGSLYRRALCFDRYYVNRSVHTGYIEVMHFQILTHCAIKYHERPTYFKLDCGSYKYVFLISTNVLTHSARPLLARRTTSEFNSGQKSYTTRNKIFCLLFPRDGFFTSLSNDHTLYCTSVTWWSSGRQPPVNGPERTLVL